MCARPQPIEIFRENEEEDSLEDRDRQFQCHLIDMRKQFKVPILELTNSRLFTQRRTNSYAHYQ